jgi:hypothetical protein
MKRFLPRISADYRGLFYEGRSRRGLIHQALSVLVLASVILLCASACEKRIVRKEERIFMDYAEQNWKKLTPRQKADYYEMIERQKERARREE